MNSYMSDFSLYEKVIIDDDRALIGTITAISFRPGTVSYEVSYVYNGESRAYWIESGRVRRVDRR